MEEKTINFEKAFGRLEEILQIMNRGEVSLDDALKLYEEADTLIELSSKRLAQAEQKIEQIIKNRDGITENVPLDSKVTVDAR